MSSPNQNNNNYDGSIDSIRITGDTQYVTPDGMSGHISLSNPVGIGTDGRVQHVAPDGNVSVWGSSTMMPTTPNAFPSFDPQYGSDGRITTGGDMPWVNTPPFDGTRTTEFTQEYPTNWNPPVPNIEMACDVLDDKGNVIDQNTIRKSNFFMDYDTLKCQIHLTIRVASKEDAELLSGMKKIYLRNDERVLQFNIAGLDVESNTYMATQTIEYNEYTLHGQTVRVPAIPLGEARNTECTDIHIDATQERELTPEEFRVLLDKPVVDRENKFKRFAHIVNRRG